MTGICSALHLMVDGLCVCCLYLMASSLSTSHLVGIFLTYNVLAFLTQPLTGGWTDQIKQRHWMLLASVVLLTMAVLTTSIVVSARLSDIGMVMVAILLGMGNSLFHVWGGKLVAVKTGNDIRALGTFVSTGAFGLALGYVFFSWSLVYVFLLAICLLSILYVRLDTDSEVSSVKSETTRRHFSSVMVWLAVIALMAAVMLRSFAGEAFSSGTTRGSSMVLMIGLLSLLGKMAGGWIAHQLGIVRMLTMILLVVTVCFLFRNQGNAVRFLGLFAVNCTMPVTLYLANAVLPGKEGLAFGLLAATLIPGYLLAYL